MSWLRSLLGIAEKPSVETREAWARFSVRAVGYPEPMYAGVCAEHLSVVLATDVSVGGSTGEWIVKALP